MRKQSSTVSTFIKLYLLLSIYSVRNILRSDEYQVLRYNQLNLNKLNITHAMNVNFPAEAPSQEIKLNITHAMNVNFPAVAPSQEIKSTFFIDFLKIKSEAEFLSLKTFFQR